MNVNIRAAAMARSNLGHELPAVETLRECRDVVSVEKAVEWVMSDLIESNTYDTLVIEAKGWISILKSNSEKQARAAWPDAMKLFEEAGV